MEVEQKDSEAQLSEAQDIVKRLGLELRILVLSTLLLRETA